MKRSSEITEVVVSIYIILIVEFGLLVTFVLTVLIL